MNDTRAQGSLLSSLKLYGLPWPLFAAAFAVIIFTAYMGKLSTDIAGTMALCIAIAGIFDEIGERLPIWNSDDLPIFFSSLFFKGGITGMDILKSAVAGSLESSDVQVTIEPGQDGISVDISSSVLRQYGRQIKKVVLETLERLDVRSAKLTLVDKGALDCTIRARVESAVYRSIGQSEGIPWEGAVRE